MEIEIDSIYIYAWNEQAIGRAVTFLVAGK